MKSLLLVSLLLVSIYFYILNIQRLAVVPVLVDEKTFFIDMQIMSKEITPFTKTVEFFEIHV